MNRYSIQDQRDTKDNFVKSFSTICELTTDRTALGTLCIRREDVQNNAIWINRETFLDCIRGATPLLKEDIYRILKEEFENVDEHRIIKEHYGELDLNQKNEMKSDENTEKDSFHGSSTEKSVMKDDEDYELTEEDFKLLDFDISLVNTPNKITRYWNSLIKLADNLNLDYTEIDVKDIGSLRELFDKEVI